MKNRNQEFCFKRLAAVADDVLYTRGDTSCKQFINMQTSNQIVLTIQKNRNVLIDWLLSMGAGVGWRPKSNMN